VLIFLFLVSNRGPAFRDRGAAKDFRPQGKTYFLEAETSSAAKNKSVRQAEKLGC
jgi:hypothetical protein